MKRLVAGIGIVVVLTVGIATVGSIAFGAKWIGLEWRGFWGPRESAVEREIFESTRSYTVAAKQQMARYRLQYMQAESDTDRKAIASTVRMQFPDLNPSDMEPELANFWRDCMNGRN